MAGKKYSIRINGKALEVLNEIENKSKYVEEAILFRLAIEESIRLLDDKIDRIISILLDMKTVQHFVQRREAGGNIEESDNSTNQELPDNVLNLFDNWGVKE